MTLDPRFSDLMNHVIDGVASDKETADLQSELDSHPEAQEELAQLKSLSRVLGRVGAVEPPRGLKETVLRSLPSSRERQTTPSRSVVRGPWGRGRMVLQYGYALAAGLLLGVALAHWNGSGIQDARSLDPSTLAGTMTSREGAPGTPILEVPLTSGRATGTVQVKRGEAGYLIALDLEAPEVVEVELAYDPGKTALRGFAQEIDAVQSLKVTGDKISWRQSGHRKVTVVMTPRTGGAARLDLRVFSHGVEAGGRSLDLPSLGPPTF